MAAHKSSGKTVFATGLCAELTRRGYSVYPFKKGPDYIDPKWLASAAKRSCYNLDFNTQIPDEIVAMFAGQCAVEQDGDVFFGDAGFARHHDAAAKGVLQGNADSFAIVEANKGLYDGVSPDGSDSNAALSKLLRAPVILVVDCEGMTRGIAPLLRGYLDFDPEVCIGGVVLNKVGGERHAAKLEAAVKQYTDVPVVGCLPRDRRMSLPERHLGLVPSNEHRQAAECIEAMRQSVDENVNLGKIIEIAHLFTAAGNDDRPCEFRACGGQFFEWEMLAGFCSDATAKGISFYETRPSPRKGAGYFF